MKIFILILTILFIYFRPKFFFVLKFSFVKLLLKPTKSNLPKQTYQTKATKPNLPNQTKPTKPNQTYQTNPTNNPNEK